MAQKSIIKKQMAMMKYLRGLFPISLNIFFNNGYGNIRYGLNIKLNKANLEKIESYKNYLQIGFD